MIRCFRRKDKGKRRHGMWIWVSPKPGKTNWRGEFIHGDHDEGRPPAYSVDTLDEWARDPANAFLQVEEISPQQVIEELSNFPQAQTWFEVLCHKHAAEVASEARE